MPISTCSCLCQDEDEDDGNDIKLCFRGRGLPGVFGGGKADCSIYDVDGKVMVGPAPLSGVVVVGASFTSSR